MVLRIAIPGMRVVDGELRPVPEGVTHAKEMGTLTTACGIPAHSLIRFFDLTVVRGDESSCEECVAIISDRGPNAENPARAAGRMGVRPAVFGLQW